MTLETKGNIMPQKMDKSSYSLRLAHILAWISNSIVANIVASLIASILIAGLAYFAGLSTVELSNSRNGDDSLASKIDQVQLAIDGIHDLELRLKSVKGDLEATEKASIQMKKEYEEAEKLKNMSQEQLLVLRKIITEESVWTRILDYAVGVVTGIGTSLAASYLFARLRRKYPQDTED